MKQLVNLEERIQRHRQFFADPAPGQILAIICYAVAVEFDGGHASRRRLDQWDFETENRDYVVEEIRKIHSCLERRRGLDDDYIPCAMVGYGAGVAAAYFTDGQVTFGDQTSWMQPVLNDWRELPRLQAGLAELKRTRNNTWFQRISEANRWFTELNEGNYLVTPFTHFGPLDLANEIRGNDLMYDFNDHPAELRRLLDLCAEATIFFQREQRRIVGPTMGGLPFWVTWVPGDPVFLSADLADLIGPDLFEQFGQAPTQKVIQAFDGGVIHHHALGLKSHPNITALANLKLLELSADPNCARPVSRLAEIYACQGAVPLMTRCTAQEVYETIDALKQGRVILRVDVASLEEGQEVLTFIRQNSKG